MDSHIIIDVYPVLMFIVKDVLIIISFVGNVRQIMDSAMELLVTHVNYADLHAPHAEVLIILLALHAL